MNYSGYLYPPSDLAIATVRANEENRAQRELENRQRLEWMAAIREQTAIFAEIAGCLKKRNTSPKAPWVRAPEDWFCTHESSCDRPAVYSDGDTEGACEEHADAMGAR